MKIFIFITLLATFSSYSCKIKTTTASDGSVDSLMTLQAVKDSLTPAQAKAFIDNFKNVKKDDLQYVSLDLATINALAQYYKTSQLTFVFGAYDKDDIPKYKGYKMKNFPVLILKVIDPNTGIDPYYDAGRLCPPLNNCRTKS